MHVLTADQFSVEEMAAIFKKADLYRKQLQTVDGRRSLAQTHLGHQICSTFYEASTRTKASFELAAIKLGMGVFQTENAGEFSSISKGETIEDSIRVLSSYGVSAIVIRSKEEGVAARAAKASPIPILNAGDGKGEHPTQSLLDAYTIHREFGRLKNLKIVMGGDLMHGRTVRSLSKLLAKYPGNHITFLSVPQLQIGDDIKAVLRKSGTIYRETHDMGDALKDADVVYWTRLQRERLTDEERESIPADGFVLNKKVLKKMPESTIIMHPLPRVGEIHEEVDRDPRAKYFDQAENGLYVRMVLLDRAVSGALA